MCIRKLTNFIICYYYYVVDSYQRTHKSVDSSNDEKPPAENEIRVSHNKIQVYVELGLKKLQKEHKKHIVIVGKGSNVNKAVSVVEIIKRNMQGTLHQYTQIGSVSVVEQWDAVKDEELDSIKVDKKIPVIIIYLSLEEMPELEDSCGHQLPTGPDIYE